MAKKVEDFVKAGENYFVVGKLMAVSKDDKTSEKTDSTWVQYNARIKTPEGVTVFVRKNRFPEKDDKPEVPFVKERFDEWDNLIDTFKETDKIIVSVSSRKSNDKPMFNWLTNYENEEGKISYNVDNFVNVLETFYNEDETTTIKFKNNTELFEDRKTEFYATMYVIDSDDKTLLLSDGKEEYPNTLTVKLPDTMENGAVIGNGYAFKLKLVKGRKHKVDDGVANWNNEVEVDYDPDTLEAVSVEKVKDMVLAGMTSKKSSKRKEVAKDDEFPF